MSATDQNLGGPIAPDSPLGRALSDHAVPGLSSGFADRVLAAAATRAPPLPAPRRTMPGRGWRIGQRIALGALGFGALASAAAATGLLERLDLPVPSPERVWASLTGSGRTSSRPSPVPAASPPQDASGATGPVAIEGAVDTPAELEEAFRRIDAVREGRIETRRTLVDQRIDAALERRRAAGLPVPSPEEEARLRGRLEEARARREAVAAERIEVRRQTLREKVESGEPVTREDLVRPLPEGALPAATRERIEELRRMSPEQRRETLRNTPPEERRARLRALRQQREAILRAEPASPELPQDAATPAADPAPQP